MMPPNVCCRAVRCPLVQPPLTPLAVRPWHIQYIQSGAPCGTADTASKLSHGQYRAQLSVGTPLTDATVLTARTHT